MNKSCSTKWLKFFKAACDENRQQILTIISNHKAIGATQIGKKIKLSQPTISHHLKILTLAKMITATKKGKQVFYSINKSQVEAYCTGFMKKMSCHCEN